MQSTLSTRHLQARVISETKRSRVCVYQEETDAALGANNGIKKTQHTTTTPPARARFPRPANNNTRQTYITQAASSAVEPSPSGGAVGTRTHAAVLTAVVASDMSDGSRACQDATGVRHRSSCTTEVGGGNIQTLSGRKARPRQG